MFHGIHSDFCKMSLCNLMHLCPLWLYNTVYVVTARWNENKIDLVYQKISIKLSDFLNQAHASHR